MPRESDRQAPLSNQKERRGHRPPQAYGSSAAERQAVVLTSGRAQRSLTASSLSARPVGVPPLVPPPFFTAPPPPPWPTRGRTTITRCGAGVLGRRGRRAGDPGRSCPR